MTTGEQLRKFSQFCLLKLVALDVHIIPRQSEVKNLFHAITCITWPVTSSSSNVSAFPLPRFLNYFFLTTLHSAGSTPSSGRSEQVRLCCTSWQPIKRPSLNELASLTSCECSSQTDLKFLIRSPNLANCRNCFQQNNKIRHKIIT